MAQRAVIVVDMVKDNVNTENHFKIARQALGIVPEIKKLLTWARQKNYHVVFANDSFFAGDFIFQGKLKPHSLRGSEGAEVVDELKPEPGDEVLPKRRFSAFYKTDLDDTLRLWGVNEILVCGISTPVCVMQTAIDAVAQGFFSTVIEDCCTAHKPEIHQAAVDLYRHVFGPLMKIIKLEELIEG